MQSQQPDDAMPAAMPGSESASKLHGARARAKARQCAEGQTIHRAECSDPISKIDSDTYNPAAFLEIYLDPAAKRDFINGLCQAGNKYYAKAILDGLNNMKLPNLSELKRVSPCGDKNHERNYDEAVQSIMKNRDQ